MSGPIIRSGPSTKYAKNWDHVFAPKKARSQKAKPKAAAKKSSGKKAKG